MVYALGVVLYELLCGEPAFPTRGKSISKALAILETHRSVRPRQLRPGITGDLEVVIPTAMAGDPSSRHATVSALREDIRRVHSHRPILAQPPGLTRQATLFARRHRVFLSALLLIVASLVSATVVSVRSERSARRAALDALQKAYVGQIAAASAALRTYDAGAARYPLDQAPEAFRGWEWNLYDRRAEGALARMHWPDAYILSGSFASAASLAVANGSGPECVRIWNLSRRTVLASRPREKDVVTACAISPEGDRVAVGRKDGSLSVCTPEGKELSSPRIPGAPAEFRSLVFSPGGALLVAGGTDGRVTCLDLERGAGARTLVRMGDAIHALAFQPTGAHLFVGGGAADPRILLLDRRGDHCSLLRRDR